MASEKQLRANRENAKRSTGPKSVTGKTLSRMNACKHGLTAESIVIGDEDPRAFDLLRAQLEADHNPRPGIERELVERMAVIMWRIRRVPVFEAAPREPVIAFQNNQHVERCSDTKLHSCMHSTAPPTVALLTRSNAREEDDSSFLLDFAPNAAAQ